MNYQSDSGNKDLENVKPPDLLSNAFNGHETMSSSDQYDDDVHFEGCNHKDNEKNDLSPLRIEKVIDKEDHVNEKTYISTKCDTVRKDTIFSDSFEHQQDNGNTLECQSSCLLNLNTETLNCPNLNSANNVNGNTLIRTNMVNDCAISNAYSTNVSISFGANNVIVNELLSGDSSNKELLELNDSTDIQFHKPDLKHSESLLENINLSSCSKLDKSTDSYSVKTSPGNVSVASSKNTLLSQGNAESNNITSLAQLNAYGSDEEDSANEASNVVILEYREDRNQDSDEESDSDSSSSSSAAKAISVTDSDSDDCVYENFENRVPRKPIKAKKELGLEDLPPIEDLKISVSKEDCITVGKVYQIVDQLVVVEALKGVPAYDLDTVLFLEGGQPLGKVFDVFGPVAEPYYSVRFNSRDHIKEKNIHLDQTVYSAPNTSHTNYVFLQQLMRLKGSDASWVDDIEPPEGCVEYSDDEQEQRSRKNKSRSGKATLNVESDPDEPARKKHFAYEERMNARNLQLSAAKRHSHSSKNKLQHVKNNLWSFNSVPPGGSNMPTTFRPPGFQNIPHRLFGRPPMFNKMALPFPPPFRSCTPFQDLSQPNFIQNTQSSLPHPNSPLPFPQQIPQWRPPCFNPGEPSNFGQNNLPCPGPSTVHSSGPTGFSPNSSNWMRFVPPTGVSPMNSPPPPIHSPAVPVNSFPSPIWTPQTNPPFPNTNNQTARCNFPSNLVQPSFSPSRPFMSVQPSPQNSLPNNPLGIGFNPNIPPPRLFANSFEISPNVSPRVTFNSNIPPPPPLPSYRPRNISTNAFTQPINFNLNIPPPSQNPFNK